MWRMSEQSVATVCPNNEPGTLGDFGDVAVQSLEALDTVQEALQDCAKEYLELLVRRGAQHVYPTRD